VPQMPGQFRDMQPAVVGLCDKPPLHVFDLQTTYVLPGHRRLHSAPLHPKTEITKQKQLTQRQPSSSKMKVALSQVSLLFNKSVWGVAAVSGVQAATIRKAGGMMSNGGGAVLHVRHAGYTL
jgi:hypothetical protein